MKTIVIEVSDPVADQVARMSAAERKGVSETLDRLIANRKSLEEIMRDASEQARKNGLTPELLKELLNSK